MKTHTNLKTTMPIILTLVLLFPINLLKSQNILSSLKGIVSDITTQEGLAFANVILLQKDTQIAGTTTDLDGNYYFKDIKPGEYNLNVSYIGYQTSKINKIIVSSSKITFLNINLSQSTLSLEEFEIKEYQVPLISRDQGRVSSNIQTSKSPAKKYRMKSGSSPAGYSDYKRENFNTEGYAYNPENSFKPYTGVQTLILMIYWIFIHHMVKW